MCFELYSVVIWNFKTSKHPKLSNKLILFAVKNSYWKHNENMSSWLNVFVDSKRHRLQTLLANSKIISNQKLISFVTTNSSSIPDKFKKNFEGR